MKQHHIKNSAMAPNGRKRIEWAEKQMPVLQLIRTRFSKEKPLKGVRISACLHVTTETAVLMHTLKQGGAEVVLCASNPLSTQDDTAAAIVKYFNIPVFAIKGEHRNTYYKHLKTALAHKPHITMDDGADLISELHKTKVKKTDIIAGTEETTTGVIRLKAMEQHNVLRFPILAVNDSQTKHLFDNRYGTGQSTIDGIMRATNMLLAGKTVVICGYGWCGRGVAKRAQGMGASVIITEVNPLKALEAKMDGFEVMPLKQAATRGDLFITVTGDIHVLRAEHFARMKNEAILANAGHFDVEIDLQGLERITQKKRAIRPYLKEYTLKNIKRIYVLADGRLVNLAAAEGHPALVMDLSFANQALGVEYMIKNAKNLQNRIYTIPEALDMSIARLKLKSMHVALDKLTKKQQKYLTSWQIGT